MKHNCYNCGFYHLKLDEFDVEFKCGHNPVDAKLGCMDWKPYPPTGDKRVLIEAYRAIKRGENDRAARIIAKHLDAYHEGAAYWASALEVPK